MTFNFSQHHAYISSKLRRIKVIQRRRMTLIETMIAMTILSVLLVFVFGFFREMSHLNELTRYQQKQVFQHRYAEYRLNNVFSHLLNSKDLVRSDYFYFFLDQPLGEHSKYPSLVFIYNNGVRLNPSFSGDVLARLYVNENHCLCLVTWPFHFEETEEAPLEMQKEILLEDVQEIKFEFFTALGNSSNQTDLNQGPKKGSWQVDWPKSYSLAPNLLKMIVTIKPDIDPLQKKQSENEKQVDELIFIFHLPTSKKLNQYIYYPN